MTDCTREGCLMGVWGSPAKDGEVTGIIKALAEGDHEPGQQLGCPALAADT